MEIRNIDNINKDLFNIYKSDVNMVPVCISINSLYYQICGFNNSDSNYIYYGEYNAADAVNLAVSFINNVSFKVLINIYNICTILQADINSIDIFNKLNIKGSKNYTAFEKALFLPEELIEYIDRKDIPLKTVSLITSQNSRVINFIKGYILENDVSVQNFRKFVEKVCDFKEIIPDTYSSSFVFPDVRSKSHQEIEHIYTGMVKNYNNIRVINNDNFESPKLTITFDISSIEDYKEYIEILKDNEVNIREFYKILEKYGLI